MKDDRRVNIHGAVQMAARPLCALAGRSEGGGCRGGSSSASSSGVAFGASEAVGLAELAAGPYFVLAAALDASALCCLDAACRLLRDLNRTKVGPWRALGVALFHGLELDQDGLFERPSEAKGRKAPRTDWKGRMCQFRKDVLAFCAPFSGQEITSVPQPDEIAYLRCRLRTDILNQPFALHGRYVEVEVIVNPNNLSMAVVDFEEGGCSSVTFSPDTGAVIRESKVQEAPRKVSGAYIQTLPVVPPGRPFHGFMGLFLCKGRIAFFRRCRCGPTSSWLGEDELEDDSAENKFKLGPWETTGFVSDVDWAEGSRLTPCLAFRDEGAYRVRVVGVGTVPPVLPPLHGAGKGGYTDTEDDLRRDVAWSSFDWEDDDAAEA
eukprot:TRINITY_DN44715_c0_g1_i1.p1 TRINITY_DN44715_c0_g1~~TRINITY_DN44715_c0_g1_i1.p1  ORF type:complete len:403 (-),score=63.00 TRINITY_DN44715_c0_g1_i1:140-1273(-)